MPPGPTGTAQSAARPRSLGEVAAAARDVLGRRPSATIAEIAEQTGVSRATLYRAVGSRRALLDLSALETEQSSRDRVLAAALEMLEDGGLERLSMDALADRAGVSRATVYRLFPGKAALFTEVVREHSPLETIAGVLADVEAEPPAVAMPAIARAVARHVEGRAGLLRTLLFEVAGPSDEAEQARQLAIAEGLGPLLRYLVEQMANGRLRRAHPLLALQAFVGPAVMHVLTRPIAMRTLGLEESLEDALVELSRVWLRAFAPSGGE